MQKISGIRLGVIGGSLLLGTVFAFAGVLPLSLACFGVSIAAAFLVASPETPSGTPLCSVCGGPSHDVGHPAPTPQVHGIVESEERQLTRPDGSVINARRVRTWL